MEKVITELKEAIINMYANLHMFQDIYSIIIDQHRKIQAKITQFNTTW
jgi:hypothetical protein